MRPGGRAIRRTNGSARRCPHDHRSRSCGLVSSHLPQTVGCLGAGSGSPGQDLSAQVAHSALSVRDHHFVGGGAAFDQERLSYVCVGPFDLR